MDEKTLPTREHVAVAVEAGPKGGADVDAVEDGGRRLSVNVRTGAVAIVLIRVGMWLTCQPLFAQHAQSHAWRKSAIGSLREQWPIVSWRAVWFGGWLVCSSTSVTFGRLCGALRRNGIRLGIGSGEPLGLRTLPPVLTQVVEVCGREEINVGFKTVQVITCESEYSSGDAVE